MSPSDFDKAMISTTLKRIGKIEYSSYLKETLLSRNYTAIIILLINVIPNYCYYKTRSMHTNAELLGVSLGSRCFRGSLLKPLVSRRPDNFTGPPVCDNSTRLHETHLIAPAIDSIRTGSQPRVDRNRDLRASEAGARLALWRFCQRCAKPPILVKATMDKFHMVELLARN